MSRESHKRYLEQVALRTARRAIDQNALDPLHPASLGQLRIQTVEPWKRILLGIVSLLLIGPGIAVLLTETLVPGVTLCAIGAGLLTLALFGRKKTIDAALDSIDVAQLFDTL
jgi:hypothetical protein